MIVYIQRNFLERIPPREGRWLEHQLLTSLFISLWLRPRLHHVMFKSHNPTKKDPNKLKVRTLNLSDDQIKLCVMFPDQLPNLPPTIRHDQNRKRDHCPSSSSLITLVDSCVTQQKSHPIKTEGLFCVCVCVHDSCSLLAEENPTQTQ